MSQFVETPTKTLPAGAALAVNRRVKLASDVLQYAGASDVSIGTLDAATFASSGHVSGYTPGTVRLITAQGTRKVVASEAITSGNPVYAAANGKVAASGTVVEGRALEAAAADGDVIEIISIANTDISATVTGTNAATFTADADATTAKVAIGTGVGTGDFTAKIVAPTLAGNTTVTLPAVTSTLASLAGTETLTNKTLTSPIHGGLARQSHTVSPGAAAGSTVSDAVQLGSTNITHITSDSAAKGAKLPTTAAGDWGIVINNSSTAAELYAASGGTVNGLSADASVVIPASKGILWFATGTNTIIAFDMPAKATAS